MELKLDGKTVPVLTDEEVRQFLPMERAIEAIERAFLAKSRGRLVHPARFSVKTNGGGLVFTAGAETEYSQAIGFRVYDTFPADSKNRAQMVVVYDSQDGALRGILLGSLAGAMRTAAINALAIRLMALPGASTLAVLGSGFQARVHLQAARLVRPFDAVRVFSPSAAHRQAFAEEMSAETGLAVEAARSAEAAVREADVILCATTSARPVLEAGWVRPGAHINTIGPKSKEAHEIPLELARRSRVIATDSLAQVDGFTRPFFLSGMPERERMVELDQILVGKQPGRLSEEDITLFCSVGLAGTEVVVADEALRLAGEAQAAYPGLNSQVE